MSDERKPTIPEVKPLVLALYRRHMAGCCLHIVLDDGNVSDDNVRFCVQYAEQKEHVECVILASLLLRMSQTQRLKLYNDREKYTQHGPPFSWTGEPKT